jgi:hypothetical protein
MKGWKRFFYFKVVSDSATLQAMLVVRLFGIDLALMLAGCVLDWALSIDLQPFQPKYFLRVSLLFAHFTIGRNNDLYL